MKKKEIQKNYKKKINKLNEYNEEYYGKDNPTISDSDYDLIKKEIFTFCR